MILITGNKGFIGTHLSKLYPKFVGCDKKDNENILNLDLLAKKIRGCQTVVHLAAQVSVPESIKDPNFTYWNNILGLSNVIQLSEKLKVKHFVFASSCAVYEKESSPYALSKSMGEHMVNMSKIKNTTNLRFFNVYGTGQNPAYGAVIPSFINSIKKEKPITIYGDGEQTRDFIFVEDVCDAIKRATKLKGKHTMDIGTGTSVSVHALAELLMSLMGKEVKIKYEPERQEVKHSKANILNMTCGLKKKKLTPLYKGLKTMI
jgi:UDP-glucose 4-epimerase